MRFQHFGIGLLVVGLISVGLSIFGANLFTTEGGWTEEKHQERVVANRKIHALSHEHSPDYDEAAHGHAEEEKEATKKKIESLNAELAEARQNSNFWLAVARWGGTVAVLLGGGLYFAGNQNAE